MSVNYVDKDNLSVNIFSVDLQDLTVFLGKIFHYLPREYFSVVKSCRLKYEYKTQSSCNNIDWALEVQHRNGVSKNDVSDILNARLK